MSRDTERAATQFFGGRVCLDYANTLDWRTSHDPQELIPTYSAFLSWSERRGTMTVAATQRLRVKSDDGAEGAARVMDRAYLLRRALWAAADNLIAGRVVDLEVFNRTLGDLPRQPAVAIGHVHYLYDLPGNELEEPLWPVLWSVTALLTSHDAARIGCCHADGCGWFFVDESPNRGRLWCSSEVCGNRERARRSYARRRVTQKKGAHTP